MVLAQDEARSLSWDHISAEHLILAMLQEGEGVAGRALKNCGLTYDHVRQWTGEGSGSPQGYLAFKPETKKCLELAMREALQLGHNYIGTEHLLLGVIRSEPQLLETLGAVSSNVRSEVIKILSGYDPTSPGAASSAGGAELIQAGWVHVVEPTHHCDFPEVPEEVGTGSIWRCTCGQRWAVDRLYTKPMWKKAA